MTNYVLAAFLWRNPCEMKSTICYYDWKRNRRRM